MNIWCDVCHKFKLFEKGRCEKQHNEQGFQDFLISSQLGEAETLIKPLKRWSWPASAFKNASSGQKLTITPVEGFETFC